MDYYYSNQYYHFPSDHHNYQLDLPTYRHLPHDFHPSYYSPYYSSPSYDHFPPQFTSAYSVSGFGGCSESILIDPAGDSTRFVISYSKSPEFNEPDFKEYDPTPYAGGYDPSATYGVPLAPSDKICYPRSIEGGTIPVLQVPLGEADNTPKDNRGGQEAAVPAPVIQVPLGEANTEEPARGTEESGYGLAGDDSRDGESLEHVPYQPSPVIPGCGLDAVDICDGLFGYWPCLEREVRRRSNGEMGNHHHHHYGRGYWGGVKSSQDWQVRTADYLFGSSNPYDYDDDDQTRYGCPASFQHQVHVNANVYSGNWL